MFFILFIIIICGFLSFVRLKSQSYIYFFFIGVLLAIYSGLRTTDADHSMYVYLYSHLNEAEVEPTFKLIVGFTKLLCDNEPILMFIIYAFLGVFIKLRAISILSNFIFLSLAIYVSEYYILQEMTQIRAGIAGGFFLLSIRPLYNKKWINFIGCCCLGILFHYSAIVLLLLPLLNVKKYNWKIWIMLIPLSYVFFPFIRVALSYLFGLSFGSEKIDAYIFALSHLTETSINIYSPIQLIRIIIAYVLILYGDKCSQHNPYFFILIKCYVIGLVSFVVFCSVDVIAFRVSEMFLLSEIVLIPMICYIIKPKKVGKMLTLGYSGILLIMMISQKILI